MRHILVLLAAAAVMPDLNQLKQMSARFARHPEVRCRRALRRGPQGAAQTGGGGARAEPPVPRSALERESRTIREITPGHLAARPLSLIHISEPTRRTPISYAVFC